MDRAAVGLDVAEPLDPAPPPPPSGAGVINVGLDGTTLVPPDVSVMGPPSVRAAQLGAWFAAYSPGGWQLTVSPRDLAALFIEEGGDEGVRGDVPFCQSVIETGWFRFGGSVRPEQNNYAGLGATDVDPHPASFPDARTGVRAQIQHLRRYGDLTATTATALHHPLVDPRFSLVSPAGKAPMWNQFGNGVWASSTNNYAGRILDLFASALRFRDSHPT